MNKTNCIIAITKTVARFLADYMLYTFLTGIVILTLYALSVVIDPSTGIINPFLNNIHAKWFADLDISLVTKVIAITSLAFMLIGKLIKKKKEKRMKAKKKMIIAAILLVFLYGFVSLVILFRKDIEFGVRVAAIILLSYSFFMSSIFTWGYIKIEHAWRETGW